MRLRATQNGLKSHMAKLHYVPETRAVAEHVVYDGATTTQQHKQKEIKNKSDTLALRTWNTMARNCPPCP
jgi:hypothetical protein